MTRWAVRSSGLKITLDERPHPFAVGSLTDRPLLAEAV